MKRAFSWLFLVCVNSTPAFNALGALVIAAMVSACAREYSPKKPTTTPVNSICIKLEAKARVKTLDIFIYSDSLNRPLEKHQRIEYPTFAPTLPWEPSEIEVYTDSLTLPCSKGGKIVIAIANSPYPFNIEALKLYDTAELLTMYYSDEDPAFPLQSAVSYGCTKAVSLKLKTLLCPVRVLSISNSTGKLLSHASLRLSKINSSAQILRSDGFRPESVIFSPEEVSHPQIMKASIPLDIGSSILYTNILLYCYPFDSATTLGTPPTEIILEAEQDGQMVSFVKELPQTTRGKSVIITLSF